MGAVVQWRRDTAANWTSANPVIYQGEAGLETDTGKFKLGDGVTAWVSLGYAALPASGGTIAGALSPTVTALAFASTVTLNAALGNVFSLTMTGACTLANPANPTDGQAIRLRLTSNGYSLTYGAAFAFGTVGEPSLSSSGLDVLGFEFDAALSAWLFLGGGGQSFT